MLSKNKVTFSIADIKIQLELEQPIEINHSFSPFLVKDNGNILIDFREKEKIDFPVYEKIYSNIFFSVLQKEKGFCRVFRDYKNEDSPYAIGEWVEKDRMCISYLDKCHMYFSESFNCFSHIALEEVLIKHDALVVHSAFVDTEYGGILFSGPSGVGKSTQADLWVRYKGAELINGDRTIVRKVGHGWKAFGSPYAGSSRCFKNKSKKIRAIVVLEQADRCNIRQLGLKEAFVSVYSETTVNTWNAVYVEKVTSLIFDLVSNIPVYRVACTPDINAVEVLEEVLKGEFAYEN